MEASHWTIALKSDFEQRERGVLRRQAGSKLNPHDGRKRIVFKKMVCVGVDKRIKTGFVGHFKDTVEFRLKTY